VDACAVTPPRNNVPATADNLCCCSNQALSMLSSINAQEGCRLARLQLPCSTLTHSTISSHGAGLLACSVHDACQHGDLAALELYIDAGGDVNAESWRATLLHTAAHYGQAAIITYLARHGAAVDSRNNADETALVLACKAGRSHAVEALLRCGASVDKSYLNSTAYSETIAALLQATPRLKALGSCERSLHSRCTKNDTSALIRYVQLGGSVDQRCAVGGDTPLMCAARWGCLAVAHTAVEHGADIELHDKLGRTALWLACEAGHADIANLLISASAQLEAVSPKTRYTALHIACAKNHSAAVTVLRAAGADVNAAAAAGLKPVHMCIRAAANSSLAALLQPFEHYSSCNVEAVAADTGERPLHAVCRTGSYAAAKLLIAAGADVNAASNSSAAVRPIHCAARSGSLDVQQLLLKSGAISTALDGAGTLAVYRCEYVECRNAIAAHERTLRNRAILYHCEES
jgi:ankyrin repeat protein